MIRTFLTLLFCLLASHLVTAQSARFHSTVTNEASEVITSAQLGDSVFLNVFVEDLRPDPSGVFAAYAKIEYDPDILRIEGEINHATTFSLVPKPMDMNDLTTLGTVDSIGGLGPITGGPIGGGVFEVFSVPFDVIGSGSADFALSPPDNQEQDGLLFYFETAVQPISEIEFVGTTLVVPEPVMSVPTLLVLLAWLGYRRRRNGA